LGGGWNGSHPVDYGGTQTQWSGVERGLVSEGKGVHTGMDQWTRVRVRMEHEGLGKRKLCRQGGITDETVQKMLTYSAAPGPCQSWAGDVPRIEGTEPSSTATLSTASGVRRQSRETFEVAACWLP
jgi:hypothetical protein